ncbi:hypothetical protein [Alkaliphilus transvaalensis]|uniref:hypothetical protein n=1 Tax=Alkaliphilus transvaalensis TaxID=114628 RepID=UPI00047E8546|nr:hypothetical protein [Alkaliphilus transvaalensis]
MCTSFIERRDSVFVAMNFDNNGMPFNLKKDLKSFVVFVDGGRGKYPSFGVNSDGTFINNLMVDSNGKGLYKRASKKVTHTSKLVGDVLDRIIEPDEINRYLENIEVVNGPDFSVHNMIVDRHGNVWVVEPGRGVICSPTKETPYFVMTNFSLCDYKESGELKGDGIDRYKTAKKLLDKPDNLDVGAAFQILEAVKQSSGEWTTSFSMVYSQKESSVYYCVNGDFKNISRHSFT